MDRLSPRIAVVGTGVIGASWAAQFLAMGCDVLATDVGPDAEEKLEAYVRAAWPALETIGLAQDASMDRLQFTNDLRKAVEDVDLVQENAPERLELKRELFADLDRFTRPETILASSSSALKMSLIQPACAEHPERCLIAHPFNPPHLVPLVEIVGGSQTSNETIERALAFYTSMGKRTIRVNKEMTGHVANRLSLALYRELLHLIAEDVVSVEDADTAVSWGPGLRWGIMGPNLLYHLAGGEGGIRHFFDHFADTLTVLFEDVGDPRLTPELVAKVISGTDEEVALRSAAELAAYRDKVLLGLLALRKGET